MTVTTTPPTHLKASRLIALLARHLADYGDSEVKIANYSWWDPDGLTPVVRCFFKPAGLYGEGDDEAIVIATS